MNEREISNETQDKNAEGIKDVRVSGDLREAEMQDSAVQIENLTSAIMEKARMLEVQVNTNALTSTTANLKNAIEYLGAVAHAALTRPVPEPLAATGAASAVNSETKKCGCSNKEEGCDPARLPSCCVELYIRQVEIGYSSIGNLTDLECIVAVKGERSWGMSDTGIAGFISLNRRNGPVPLNAVIERHCVPCNGTKTVPLWFQCREIDKVGRDEVGSARGFITLRCDCEIPDLTQKVTVTGSVLGTFDISITIGARVIPGGCC